MPPKQRITREMILERSFEMFCREGMGVVNARSVANALNCSTQPIFSYFSGMQDLKTTLEEKAKAQFEAALHVESQTGDPLVSLGCAYTRFAGEQPHLFAHLFALKQEGKPYPMIEGEQLQALLRSEVEYTGLSMAQAEALCDQMIPYIHGLAVLLAAHRLDHAPDAMEKRIADAQEITLAGIRSRAQA